MAIIYGLSNLHKLNRFLRKNGLPRFKPRTRVTWKDPLEKKRYEAPIGEQWFMPRSDLRQSKMIYEIVRFQFERKGRKEERIRIGYYIIGKKPRVKNKWTWGQFCPYYRTEDLKALLPLLKDILDAAKVPGRYSGE